MKFFIASSTSSYQNYASKVIYKCLKDDTVFWTSMRKYYWWELPWTYKRWHFPNAFAAVDGKHITLFHPRQKGSKYYNYNGPYSVVLLALVYYDYKFRYIDIGCQGGISDERGYNNSVLKEAINLTSHHGSPYQVLMKMSYFVTRILLHPFFSISKNLHYTNKQMQIN